MVFVFTLFPFSFLFLRRSLNLYPYIALLPRRFPPPRVYPWKAFLMGPMWYSQRPLPLLLHIRLLPKLSPLPSSRYLEKVLMSKGLVRLHLCLPRDPLLQSEPFLLPLFKPRSLIPFCRLLFQPVTLLQLSPRLQRAVPPLLLLLPPFPALLPVVLIRTYPQRDPMTFLRIPMMRLS